MDFKDIQGIIIYGYGHLPLAKYVMLQITETSKAKAWLKSIEDDIQDASKAYDKDEPVINLAFTYQGIKKMGLSKEALSRFDAEFIEDIDTPHKNRTLGDNGKSSPEQWAWGGKHNEQIDVLLALFGKEDKSHPGYLEKFYEEHCDKFLGHGLKEVAKLEGRTLKDRKGHFGFRDGISQPALEGTLKAKYPRQHDNNKIKAGEMLLGYKNEYEQFGLRPVLDPKLDEKNILPIVDPEDQEEGNINKKDFAKNGSYLVFRQLSQDVKGFWEYMESQTLDQDGKPDYEAMIKLASKMVGRWLSGAPITLYPDKDPDENPNDPNSASNNDFFGYEKDIEGYGCPFGAHLRRTNPRNYLLDNAHLKGDAKFTTSADISKRHRIIRRGRPYGEAPVESMNPVDMLKLLRAKALDHEVGLQFLAFNTEIARQFEFMQHSWSNNPKFQNLYKDPDPISGEQNHKELGNFGSFTAPAKPVSKHYKGIPQFVHTRGGAYFFMPGIRAIKYLASL